MNKYYLVIPLLLVFMAAFYFFDKDKPLPAKTISPTSTPYPTPYLSPTPTPVWKTYKNPKLGISFQYPVFATTSLDSIPLESTDQLLYLRLFSTRVKGNSFISIEAYKGDLTVLPPGPTPIAASPYITGYQRQTIGKISFEEYTVVGNCRPHTFQTVYKDKTFVFQDVCGPRTEFKTLIESVKFN